MSEKDLQKLDTLKAIYERWKRGVDKEKDVAKAMLDKLMTKYGITWDDLDDTRIESRYYKFNGRHRSVVIGVASMYFDWGERPDLYRRGKGRIEIKTSKAKFYEFKAHADFYLSEYAKAEKRNYKLFQQAFCQKNELYSNTPSDPDKKRRWRNELSMEDIMEMWAMMNNIRKKDVKRSLEHR